MNLLWFENLLLMRLWVWNAYLVLLWNRALAYPRAKLPSGGPLSREFWQLTTPLRSAMTTIRFIIMPDNRLVQVDWSVSIYFAKNDNDRRTDIFLCAIRTNIWRISLYRLPVVEGGGPRVVVSTVAFHARVRGSVPGLKETKMFLPHPRVKVSIAGSLRDREVACSASDRQGSNLESCVWRTVSSQSSHHPQEFSLYVHKGGLKPDSFHFPSSINI